MIINALNKRRKRKVKMRESGKERKKNGKERKKKKKKERKKERKKAKDCTSFSPVSIILSGKAYFPSSSWSMYSSVVEPGPPLMARPISLMGFGRGRGEPKRRSLMWALLHSVLSVSSGTTGRG